MGKKIPVVSIIGRANVGKSTLFNALVGKRLAVVDDLPGVTRDRKYGVVERDFGIFKLVDTGGVVGADDVLQSQVRFQAEIAVQESDLIIGVLDGVHGVHPQDSEVVDFLRCADKPIIWAVNKCERPLDAQAAAEFYALGIKDPLPISAAYGEGIKELLEQIFSILNESCSAAQGEEQNDIKVAFVGKPNVGKSTLINKLLGEERVICSDIPGTTRDCIDVQLEFQGTQFTLVDTAGLRKKAKIEAESIERFSNIRSLSSIDRCDVAVLVLDAQGGAPTDQDAAIAKLIHERGKSFVIAVTKWDAVEKDYRSAKAFEAQIFTVLHLVRYAPVLFVSGLSGKRCAKILEKAKEVYTTAQHRIPTGELNRVLSRAIQRNPPPSRQGDPAKLFFATQVEVQPPRIVIFLNSVRKLSDTYQRYLKRELRRTYPFEGCDIKFELRRRGTRSLVKNPPMRNSVSAT